MTANATPVIAFLLGLIAVELGEIIYRLHRLEGAWVSHIQDHAPKVSTSSRAAAQEA